MEKVIEKKICKCGNHFEITDKDLEFYDKVSPVFGAEKCLIPSPTLCPDCRQQRRLLWRNERSLYKNACSSTGKNVISCFSPDKPYVIYEPNEWWSDKWDALDYARDFDFSRSFFEQLNELSLAVPKLSMVNNIPENSDYCHQTTGLKNCYLCCNSVFSEDCLYSKGMSKCANVIDCLKIYDSTDCYECIDSHNCFKCTYLRECSDCNECNMCKDCVACRNCFGCVGLRNAEYQIFNIKYSKEDYEKRIIELKTLENKKKVEDEFTKLLHSVPHKYAKIVNSEACSGDNIYDSKNSNACFDIVGGEDLKYCFDLRAANHNSMDACIIGNGVDNCYQVSETGLSSNHCLFTNNCWQDVSNIYYSLFCIYGSNNCFGCVGLRGKSFCILNKQYTEEEYNKLVPQIIEHMRTTLEWGEFFPASLSPFGYNETVASEYYTMSKTEALENNFNWSDYENPKPDVTKIIPASKLPALIGEIPDDIINWAIECEVTGKAFRIIKPELEFYRKHSLPIPRRHPDVRHMDRMGLRNPRKIFERKCDKCSSDIMTTFSPQRLEIVYCETCYNNENI